MNLPNTFAIYFYSLFMFVAWLTMWFVDICKWLDGTNCNDTEAFTIRICSFVFLYLGALTLLLAHTNMDNLGFLKRLAFHIEYGVAVLIGTLITIAPSGVEPKGLHLLDLISCFILFMLLHFYTSTDLAPVGMYQSPWEGHGVNPRSLLTIIAVSILVKVVTGPDFFPLSTIMEDPGSVTVRAETFYSIALSLALAFKLLLAVPIHYGNARDQLNTTVLIAVVEFGFGLPMFWGFLSLISSKWTTMMWVGMAVFCGLILVVFIKAYFDAKRGKYDLIPSNGGG